jgi:hypothetical protein
MSGRAVEGALSCSDALGAPLAMPYPLRLPRLLAFVMWGAAMKAACFYQHFTRLFSMQHESGNETGTLGTEIRNAVEHPQGKGD